MQRRQRRGSAVLLAVAVLALLFTTGSALLLTAHQQSNISQAANASRETKAIPEALTQGALIRMRADAARSSHT